MSETTDIIRELTRDYDAAQGQLTVATRVIAILMGDKKTKTITAAKWESSNGTGVWLEEADDGALIVKLQ